VAIARQILPLDITLQIPPNLISLKDLHACLAAGASDLGGISPKDEVNPDYPHPHDENLAVELRNMGWQLQPRLPIYPQYDEWLSGELKERVRDWRCSVMLSQLAALPFRSDPQNIISTTETQAADHQA
jgi:7,8-didemethyl-8-hydroxy-5-deazariboflavin synthase